MWKGGDIPGADVVELENLDVPEIHARRLNAKEVLTPKKESVAFFPGRGWNSKIAWKRSWSPRVHLWREQPVMSEDLRDKLMGNSERSQPTETKDGAEARNDFWSVEGDFIHRHHVEPRVQLFVPKEETFPIPLKYIEVTRTTHTNLDVWQESGKDDYWNVDVDRHLSD